jgi:eukaryotic-like serine/threonine-protein kinase
MAGPTQLVGLMLGNYRIIEQIGAGGMGVVYRAHDEQLERDVAIKVLPVGTLTDEAARKRFRKEALALAKLNHPNIATIFEFSSQNGKDYLVTEYISGLTLDEKLAASALSEKEVVGLGIQLAQGLGAAHEHGIVHRDLKPANLRLTPDQRVKILDFGLAQLMPHASELGLTATLTQSQEVSGTLPYMAPEQLRAAVADARSDIWAAGAVLYEMATAHRPFEEKVPTALIDDIIHKTPLSPRSLKHTLSPKLAAVILKCLEKEPAQRYQSARELQADLERLSTGASPLAAGRRLWPIIAASTIVVVMLAVGAFLSRHRNPRLTEKDTIVLADFTNSTGDNVFDDTLKQALNISLRQSPFLNVLSDAEVAKTLQQMRRPANTKLTPEVARELCQRAGSKAYLAGSIGSLSSKYVLGLKAVNCQNEDTLTQQQVTAASKEEVLDALGKAASKLRGELGESLPMVQRFDVSVEATTSSLEALRAYSMGVNTKGTKGYAESIPFFKRAVELDPHFALAHEDLGNAYYNLGELSLSAESIKEAYELRERVSEREKYNISALYYTLVTGEAEEAIQTDEAWAESYPRDEVARRYLGGIYRRLGLFDKAVAQYQLALRLEPNDAVIYGNLAMVYIAQNRLDDAKTILEQARGRKLDHGFLHFEMYHLAFLNGDSSGMQQQMDWAIGRPRDEGYLLSAQSKTEAYYGRLAKAREFCRRAVQSAIRADSKESAAYHQVDAALIEAVFGNSQAAKREVVAALALSRGRDVIILSALTLARVGDHAGAESLLGELERSEPSNTLLKVYWLPTIRAAVAVTKGIAAQALASLETVTPYELSVAGSLEAAYVRGQAYLLAQNGAAAASEFQKLLHYRGLVQNNPTAALVHLQLGRAYALEGDTGNARANYQDFLALWKDADPDIPILKQAKAEYAKLQ